MAHEQRRKVPAFETSDNQNKCADQLEKKNEDWKPSASGWLNSQGYIQNGSDSTMIQASTSFVDMKTDAEINTEKEFQGLDNQFGGSKTIPPIVTGETKELAVDRLSHVIYKRKRRFDFVYCPNRQEKGL